MADGTITFEWTRLGKKISNVLAFSNFGEDSDWAKEVVEELEPVFDAIMSTVYGSYLTLNSMLFTFNPGPGQWSHREQGTWMPLAGSGSTGQPCANQTRVLVSNSYAGTRPNRGRCYWPGSGEDFCADGLWVAGITEPLADLLLDWAANGINTSLGTIFLRIARRALDGTLTMSNPVDSCTGQPSPGTQRRGRL